MNEISRQPTPMIESADTYRPTHIDIEVPRNPDHPKKAIVLMTKTEQANTVAWARKDEIDQMRMP